MRIVNMLVMMALAVAFVSGTAAAQGASWTQASGTGPAPAATQTFTLGGDTSYTIGPISKIDAWRSSEMGIPVVMLPAGATAYVAYSTGVPSSPGSSTDMARMVVFGPPGYVGTGAWPGTGGSTRTFSFAGTADQYFMITQQSGGTIDRVVVGFG